MAQKQQETTKRKTKTQTAKKGNVKSKTTKTQTATKRNTKKATTQPRKKAVQTKKNKKALRHKKRRNPNKLFLCVLVELIVLAILAGIIGWNHGLEDFLWNMSRPVVKELDLSGIQSSQAVLMQARGGKVIGKIGEEERIYPASMTKMMTVVVALEKLKNPNQRIRLDAEIFEKLYGMDATQAGFQPGEEVRVIDLLYGAMLPSGAECCLALAYEIGGSEEGFAELMNRKAEKIGMQETHFCNATGLHEEGHYSTVKDLALLLKYALRNETFREIAESRFHSTGVTNIHPDGITYYSTLFKKLSDPAVTGGQILGGKTGYTDEAGLCLASYAEIEGREYILVTAGAFGSSTDVWHIQDALTIYHRLGIAAQELSI